ncbi:MAG TPA: phosphoglycerate kinase, partial [Phaeodactylibacter sp.]|nr:phosphoglycerate kinase [Phaeodactylibacter sp.]
MNLPFHGKKVLLRVDFNVPLDEHHRITDDTRIRAAIPTIQKILDEGGAVILLSHLGRPGKKRLPDGSIDQERFTLRHLVPRLSELLKRPVAFVDETVGPKARAKAKSLLPGEVLLLENVRFNEGETKGDSEFARQLAELAD